MLWEFLKWLSTFDIVAKDRNVLSIAVFGVMCVSTLYISIKRKRGLYSILDAAIFPYLFYALLDFSNYVMWSVLTLWSPALFYMAVWAISYVPICAYSYLSRKSFRLNLKYLLICLPFSIALMILSIFYFGTWNMRDLAGDARATFYVVSFIPMWAMWLIAYLKALPSSS